MTTRIEKMVEVCERRKREIGGDCADECISIGWCDYVYAGVKVTGSAVNVREDTPARRYFLHKHLPFLRELMSDSEKLDWCREYYCSNGEDKWGLRARIYDELMHDAYDAGLIPRDYAETADEVTAAFGEVSGRRLDERSLHCLSDKQVVAMVALQIRGDYWDFGSLMRESIPSGDLLYYLGELRRRWS